MQTIDSGAFFSVTEAGKAMGLHRNGVLKQITSGAMKAIRVGNSYAIPRAELSRARSKRMSQLEKSLRTLKSFEV